MATFPGSNPFYGMDDLSAALAVQLLLEDSEQLRINSKGKSRELEVSDAELALAYFEEDLGKVSVILADRQMTQSIGVAVQTDGNVLTELSSQEQEAGSDREVALRLGGQAVPPRKPWIVSSAEMDEGLLAKLSARYVSSPAPNDESGGPASADSEGESGMPVSTGFGGAYPHSKKRRCTACQEYQEFSKIARAPCGHEYCEDCLRNLFESSMTDESLFPPRCCKQSIPTGAVRIFLTSELIDQYELKKIEFGTTNRTYCSSPRCSVFLHTENIDGDRGTCPDCGVVTCTMCKTAAHEGDCPADTDLQLVLATAAENQWQRCYSCRRLVELDTGCNHITCASPTSQTHRPRV
jgi:IBR domain, a half RING-finger domain